MRGFWDPIPSNYFIAWMIRNEDFFVLRWGNLEFIRQHIATNHHEYVKGYGSLDQTYLCIEDFVRSRRAGDANTDGRITPLELAEEVEQSCREALGFTKGLRKQTKKRDNAFTSELDDIETWANLGLYFADRIRGGVALATFRQSKEPDEKAKAINYLEKCVGHWQQVIHLTDVRPLVMPST